MMPRQKSAQYNKQLNLRAGNFSMPGVKYERDSVDKAECTFQGDGQTAAFLSHRSVELSIRQQVSSDLAFRKFFEILFTALHQAS